METRVSVLSVRQLMDVKHAMEACVGAASSDSFCHRITVAINAIIFRVDALNATLATAAQNAKRNLAIGLTKQTKDALVLKNKVSSGSNNN